MVDQEQVDRLEAIYAALPTLDCRGKCQQSCWTQAIDASDLERQRVSDAGVELLTLPTDRLIEQMGDRAPRVRCPALGAFGQCRVYAVRPLICRVWGATAMMRACPYGCRPSRVLSLDETLDLLSEVCAIDGSADLGAMRRHLRAELPKYSQANGLLVSALRGNNAARREYAALVDSIAAEVDPRLGAVDG